ncbi:hypothetical protein JMJ77_0015415 [Colletotrichum scovillei]|uniref:Uncharacterized protein n=1 Tax=Colletotrichum scovillei TaxID=1209932 RepID=A0A9P7R2U8_9PEZI|nr:hypothetical protein JMJ77_0015415 [Colletotrichum scovillei]KAG7057056.1 hypothetical protein JMJ78_0000840 [Colletotrichum scovillei]KAG7066971.1 hypothetical protein JMJ76_0000816 [Colletotrichum scovillei]
MRRNINCGSRQWLGGVVMAHPTHALFSRWAATNTGPNSTSSKLSCCFLPSKAPSSQKSQELRSVGASL